MADEASRPLLDGQARSSSDLVANRPARPDQQRRSFELSSESTPLLHRRDENITSTYETTTTTYGTTSTHGTEQIQSRPSSIASYRAGSPDDEPTKRRVPSPTIISLTLLTAGVLAILFFAFAAPAMVKDYSQEAAVFTPGTISIDSTTPDGVRARIQGQFTMDSDRVKSKTVRNVGRFMTWIAREVETGPSDVDVYLPEYGNILIGSAALPNIKVKIRNGHENKLDFLADLKAGDIKGIQGIAVDWVEGRLAHLRVKGKASLHLKSGLISLGTQILTDTVTFEEKDFPALPDINLTQLNVHDGYNGTMEVEASVGAMLHSPVAITIPPLGFEILVPNCSPGDPYILAANARSGEIHVASNQLTNVSVEGLVQKLPDALTSVCPGEKGSPLDFLVSSYIKGLETIIYVRGADAPSPQTPRWMVDLLRSVTVPLPFTNRALENLVKNFTMTDTHFTLPSPFADPDSPDAKPTVSALVKCLVALPEEMNLNVDVPFVRAFTDVFYKGKELGKLNIEKWQDSNSTLVTDEDGLPAMLVEFAVKEAPLQVTDDGLLSRLVQDMLWGSKAIILHVNANVDAKVSTGLGQFAVRGIPADGDVPLSSMFS
ncbi:hypothetical protein N7466_001896 [Penicillium verhagenii]|uniref:uncharacterized protein n=1 Tax=Penicillium verhagenii TaxID=1562060 RepID=UPI0025456290|nr:uncharacterized protein N7466_001896 [Penicillium verhagenii]KAJ5938762.1 hypothetical protein N7466_001896 [Penicillium verhagenii]